MEKAVKKKEEEKAVKMKDSVDLEKKVHACNEAITDIKNRDISKHEKFVKKYKGEIQKNKEHIDKKEKELEKLSQTIKSDKILHEIHTKDLDGIPFSRCLQDKSSTRSASFLEVLLSLIASDCAGCPLQPRNAKTRPRRSSSTGSRKAGTPY